MIVILCFVGNLYVRSQTSQKAAALIMAQKRQSGASSGYILTGKMTVWGQLRVHADRENRRIDGGEKNSLHFGVSETCETDFCLPGRATSLISLASGRWGLWFFVAIYLWYISKPLHSLFWTASPYTSLLPGSSES